MVKIVWRSELVPMDMDITQVSGILLDNKKRVLIYEEDGRYRLPGGHPLDDEAIEETLVRECLEEVNTEIENILYLGYQEIIGDADKEPYAQVRMIAKIKNMGEEKMDPDNGKTYKRLLVPLNDVNTYLKWAEVGDEMIKEVNKLISG
ncbi:MAG: NUDIX hydrolase [Bacilli bacterium]|nr:NUDIX hydrolase [Bacilli bacterium]